MTNVLLIGLFFIALSAVVNVIEIRKFVKAFALLNLCTTRILDYWKYPVRLFRITFLLSHLGLDAVVLALGGGIGFANSVTGGILGIAASCVISLLIKFMYWWFGRVSPETRNFEVEYSKLKS